MARKTVGKLNEGEKGNLYPSRVLYTGPFYADKWVDPADLVYDAPGIGAQVERTESGFIVRVRYGAGYPRHVDLSEAELEEAGYVRVVDYQIVGYLWPNS